MRFVVLEHDYPKIHWDFMLEDAGFLKTWRLSSFPPAPGEKVVAEEICVHRMEYLDYEGPVSGGRGQVVRRDRGVYEMEMERREGGELTAFSFFLEGSVLWGSYLLKRLEGFSWQFWQMARGERFPDD